MQFFSPKTADAERLSQASCIVVECMEVGQCCSSTSGTERITSRNGTEVKIPLLGRDLA